MSKKSRNLAIFAENISEEEKKLLEQALKEHNPIFPELDWVPDPVLRIRLMKLEKKGYPAIKIFCQLIYGLKEEPRRILPGRCVP
jgi:hypothetical protein